MMDKALEKDNTHHQDQAINYGSTYGACDHLNLDRTVRRHLVVPKLVRILHFFSLVKR